MNTRHDVRMITTANCVRHTCFKFRNFHLICWSRSSWICCICCTACFHVFESRSGFFFCTWTQNVKIISTDQLYRILVVVYQLFSVAQSVLFILERFVREVCQKATWGLSDLWVQLESVLRACETWVCIERLWERLERFVR